MDVHQPNLRDICINSKVSEVGQKNILYPYDLGGVKMHEKNVHGSSGCMLGLK